MINRALLVPLVALTAFAQDPQATDTLSPPPPPPVEVVEPSVAPSPVNAPCGKYDPDCSKQKKQGRKPARAKRIPPGHHLERRPLLGLVAGGVGLFSVGYLPMLIGGAAGNRPFLTVPVFGPMINYRSSSGWFSGFVDALHIIGIVIDVGTQVAGLAMIIVGASVKMNRVVPDGPQVSFVPVVTGNSFGAGLVGRF